MELFKCNKCNKCGQMLERSKFYTTRGGYTKIVDGKYVDCFFSFRHSSCKKCLSQQSKRIYRTREAAFKKWLKAYRESKFNSLKVKDSNGQTQ